MTIRRISLGHFIKHKPLIFEECPVISTQVINIFFINQICKSHALWPPVIIVGQLLDISLYISPNPEKFCENNWIFFIIIFQPGNPTSQHHEPMVAMICPEKQGDNLNRLYHNQYINADGKWTTDFDHKATCRQDKVEILEYCRKVGDFILFFLFFSDELGPAITFKR